MYHPKSCRVNISQQILIYLGLPDTAKVKHLYFQNLFEGMKLDKFPLENIGGILTLWMFLSFTFIFKNIHIIKSMILSNENIPCFFSLNQRIRLICLGMNPIITREIHLNQYRLHILFACLCDHACSLFSLNGLFLLI